MKINRALLASLVVGASLLSESARASNCVFEIQDHSLTVEVCDVETNLRSVRLTIPRADAPLVVVATFPARGTAARPQANRLWQRMEPISGNAVLTSAEQEQMRLAVLAVGPQKLSPAVHSLVDFLANFVEPGQRLQSFDRRQNGVRAPFGDVMSLRNPIFTMICDSIGKEMIATFTAKGLVNTQPVMVGDRETRCKGRCGYGCEQMFQWRRNQYTQQCLDHDVCREFTGQQLGECKDEFWAAADGYMEAPDCLPPVLPVPPLSVR